MLGKLQKVCQTKSRVEWSLRNLQLVLKYLSRNLLLIFRPWYKNCIVTSCCGNNYEQWLMPLLRFFSLRRRKNIINFLTIQFLGHKKDRKIKTTFCKIKILVFIVAWNCKRTCSLFGHISEKQCWITLITSGGLLKTRNSSVPISENGLKRKKLVFS